MEKMIAVATAKREELVKWWMDCGLTREQAEMNVRAEYNNALEGIR